MISDTRTEEVGWCADCQTIATCHWFKGTLLCVACIERRLSHSYPEIEREEYHEPIALEKRLHKKLLPKWDSREDGN
jgi:hypothetical protein